LDALENDPDWIAARKAEDDERIGQATADRKASLPLLDDLREVGWHVESVWDLVNTPIDYPEAVPVLLQHIRRDYPSSVIEGTARALAVPFAPEAYPVLLDMFREVQVQNVQDGVALALQQTGGIEKFDQILQLTRDRTLGPSRVLFIRYFCDHLKGDDLRSLLTEFAEDAQLEPEATHQLKRLNRRKSK
jgi:hypothetical protein